MSSTQGADPQAGSASSAQVALGRWLKEERERMVSLTLATLRDNLVFNRSALPPFRLPPQAQRIDRL